MLAYHGTKAEYLDPILTSGLAPRGDKPSRWPGIPSRSDLVYMTTFGHFFYGKDLPGLSVIEIDMDRLDQSRLLPDEDYLHQTKKLSLEDARARLEDFQDEWRNSLSEFGTCAFKGEVTSAKITRARFVSFANARFVSNWYEPIEIMEIGADEYKAKGKIISQATSWVFDDTDALPNAIKWDAKDRSPIKRVR